MKYKYHEQTCATYKDEKYGQGTIYSSGCGPASLCNALDNLGIVSRTVRQMCAFSVSCGARVVGGTDESVLLKHASEKFGFEYRTTNKNNELLAHLKSGGAAIVHAGSNHPLFSNGGHYVCAVGVSGDTVTILDSYWYSGKYTQTALRRKYVKVVERGVIQTSIAQIGYATADRSPCYYLISKKKPGVYYEQEDKDMKYYRTIKDVPDSYRPSMQKLMDKGFLKGTGNGEINVSEDMCRILTILDRAKKFE